MKFPVQIYIPMDMKHKTSRVRQMMKVTPTDL